jgi:hypothetical protein
LELGVFGSEAAEGEGDRGVSDGGARDEALLLDGLEIFAAAAERVPLKALACRSRYDDMVSV